MSDTLNLLSDSTFGDKLDEQNAILEDIRDNMGGGNLAGTIATIETSPAAAAHAVGEYIYYNTKLYKVTAAIALGDTLTVGTNIAETKVMDEIPSVTNSIASGSTDVPTSDAVYSAIQSASSGVEFIVPKSTAQASRTDDLFISADIYTHTSPHIASNYSIYGKAISFGSSSVNYMSLWFNMNSFGINSVNDFWTKITPIIISITPSSVMYLDLPQIAPNYQNYIVLSVRNFTNGFLKIMKE